MHGNIIEIGTENKKLSVSAGFLRISEKEEIIKDIPFDLILSIIVTSSTAIYTQPLLQKLAEENIPLIICSKNYLPSGIFLPLSGNYKQSYVQWAQSECSLPLQKRLWQQIVKYKIEYQAKVLQKHKKKDLLSSIVNKVASGDEKNAEATAAKRYFPALFGGSFKRNTEQGGINSFLNYGYAVIRACTARFVVAAGLMPSIAVKHKNRLNPFCLVDDLMEPFRPLVDDVVFTLFDRDRLADDEKLNTKYKKILAGILAANTNTGKCISPVYNVIENFVRQYVDSLVSKNVSLDLKYILTDV